MASKPFVQRAQDLLERRDAGAPWPALDRLAGWQETSVNTIVSKARCGKLKPKARPGGWTDAMDAVLTTWWDIESSHVIAGHISHNAKRPVSHWAVNARARRLGLKKPETPSIWSWRARRGK